MRKSLVLTAVLAISCGEARAFHPLTGEDTLFLGRDRRQVEAGLDYAVSNTGQHRYATGAAAEFSYGLWDRLDILVTIPWQGWSSRGISESGLGDALVELKFPVADRAGWTLALKPGFSLPAGDEGRSLGAGKGGVWVYGLAGRAAGPWQFYLNAGFMLNRNSFGQEEHILKGSAAAALELLPKTLVVAEILAQTNKDKSSFSHPLSSVFGFVWSPYPTLDLDAGVRLGLNKTADDLGLLAGLTLRL